MVRPQLVVQLPSVGPEVLADARQRWAHLAVQPVTPESFVVVMDEGGTSLLVGCMTQAAGAS
jgi:hypothetical protein